MSPGRMSSRSATAKLSIRDVLSALAELDCVDGIALHGNRAAPSIASETDYDLLVLVTERPFALVQIFTHIQHRAADILWMDTVSFDEILAETRRVSTDSPEGMFMLKLQQAEIIFDRFQRLRRSREMIGSADGGFRIASHAARYQKWFALNFRLAHARRMANSSDSTYLTATDLLLTANLNSMLHAYFDFRQLVWPGEKAAIRHLATYDPAYLNVLRECLAATERDCKLALCEKLVQETLKPFGEVWDADSAAVCLSLPIHDFSQASMALEWWENLFTGATDTGCRQSQPDVTE